MEAIGVAAAEPAESHEGKRFGVHALNAVEIALEAKRNPLSFLEKRIRKKFSATVTDETVTEISPHENVRQREADTLRKRRRSSHGKVKESVSDALQPLSSAHCPENKLRSSAAQLTKQASESSSQMSTSACMAASALPPIDPMKMVTPARPVSKRLPGSSPHTSTSAGSAHYGSQTAALPTSARRNTRGLSDSSTRGSVSTGEVITTPSPSRPGPASIPAKKRRKLSATVSTPVVDSGEATSTPVTPRHDKPRVLVEIRSRISFSASSPGSQDQDFNDNSPTAKPIGEFSVDIPTVQASSPRRKSMSSRGPVLSSRAGEKLNEVLYELFAAEDSLDANDAQGRLLSEIFVPDANPDATPIVTTDFLRKVVSLVNKCAGAGKLDQVEDGKLTRLMKILDAQIRAVESLDLPFGENAETDECDSATTPTRRKSKGRCGMQVGERDGAEDDGEDDEAEVSEFAEQVTVKVEKILNGVEAAILALTMLSQAKLPKHLYSEDLIGACINLSRIHLANTVIPALRASALVKNQEQFAANGRQMMQLRRLLRHGSLKRLLTVVMPTAVSTLFQRLFDVIQLTRLSDSLVVSVGYASVMPFFVDMPTGVTRASAGLAEERTLDGIRLACLVMVTLTDICASSGAEELDPGRDYDFASEIAQHTPEC
ncbi:MAG: hypothetical protein BJ554DRAFT_5134 [Olpidium bornovanus]|uniref:Uncharacterized protein n=1 Tax=Olpidium bornovanus TaxID=278681 RepID=A0A8H7ZLX8_9FUNG|nr:MAG: hypothetical protein BJ554DRAFT_5134 [Olpidium bornovanus]